MTDRPKLVAASTVAPGDRVRADGDELRVTRIEAPFMGMPDYIAFVEDTPQRWFKRVVAASSEIELLDAD